jgi:hypothetical protein
MAKRVKIVKVGLLHCLSVEPRVIEASSRSRSAGKELQSA